MTVPDRQRIYKMKVLIVDDEKLTREGLRNKIDWNGLGFTDVRCADDGLHGLEIGRQFRPDVILTDVRMPKLNGIQMSEQIQQLCPESSIIIMSGYSDKEYLKAAIRLRAVSYVEKPISLEEITAALREAVVRVENENRSRTRSKEATAFDLTQYPDQRRDLYLDPSWFRIPPESFQTAFTVLIRSYDLGGMTTEDSARLLNGKLTDLFRNMSLDWLYAPRSPLFIFQMFSRLPLSDLQVNYLGGRITGELSDHLKSFHVIIGRQVRDYHNLHESYGSAVISLQTAFFLPANTYLMSSSAPEKNTFRPLDESYYEDLLKKLLTSRDAEGLGQYHKELLSALIREKEHILPNQVKDLYYRLHLLLWATARSMQLDPEEALNSNVIWNDISSCNIISELDGLLTKNISSVINAMNTPSGESEAVYSIKNYIARTYSDPGLSIKEISTFAHLSTSYICTMFKNETGQTLNQYITEFRMARARDLLDDPHNKIVEVAEQVGYNDSNYFSKTFRKTFGMSPSEYREQSMPGGVS